MRIINANDENAVSEAVETLNNGGLIVYPTETCYGLGCDATNSKAVDKLLDFKRKIEGKSIPIAVSSLDMASRYAELNRTAESIYKNFTPGPVTIVSKAKSRDHLDSYTLEIDERLKAENNTIGIRIPNFRLVLDILDSFNKPITATAANTLNGKTPYSINDVLTQISDKQKKLIDLIIDAGKLPQNPPSTVIDTTTEELVVYRKGRIDPIEFESIESKETTSDYDTIQYGSELIKKIMKMQNDNDYLVILLNGELGAGKTHFMKGIAKGLGINQVVKSPTYNYVNEYKFPLSSDSNEPDYSGNLLNDYSNKGKLIHFDAWRIQSLDDLKALGFYDWFKGNTIVVIEWPSVISNLDTTFFDSIDYYYIDFLNLGNNKRSIRVFKKESITFNK